MEAVNRPSAVRSSAHQETPREPRRVILLGASNLTRAFNTVVATASAYWGAPLEIFAALGHGRSYGMASSVLGRVLPGMLQCGLWDALAERPPLGTAALITDIGNDLLYEVPPGLIAEWVEECVERVQRDGARVVMTMLPLANAGVVSEWQFSFLRTCFFAGCHLSLSELARRASDLDGRLRAICARRGVAIVEQRLDWYGFDPIHILRRHWRAAWGELLTPWCDGPPPEVPRPTRRRGVYLWLRPPLVRSFFGIERRHAQPSGRLRDGSTVGFY